MTDAGGRREPRQAEIGDAVIERVNRDASSLSGIRKDRWQQLSGLVGPVCAFGPGSADLEAGLVGGENLKRRRTKGRAGLHRERIGPAMVRRRDLQVFERALAAVASAGQILCRLRRPCRHRVIRDVNRMRTEQHPLRDGRIARNRRIVSRTLVAYRLHRGLQCRAR
jgi:hypothetical protein